MCFVQGGKIERCEHCSETDFAKLLNIFLDGEPARPARQLVAPMAPQQHLSRGHPQPSRPNLHVDQHGNATARNVFDREQAQTQYSQPSSSSSRPYAATALIGEENSQTSSQTASQSLPYKENKEALTAGMDKLPRPSWEHERIILPQLQEGLAHENYFRRQEQMLDRIWGVYGEEREALAATHTPELEENWTPIFEEDEDEDKAILEEETSPWDEIWGRSVLEGEAWMRDILGEDGTWPPEAPEEADIWTREPGGMLSSAVQKQLLAVFTLEESLRE